MSLEGNHCEHLENFSPSRAHAAECAECVKTGDRWVHLRTCEECGVTLCCDSSPNKHATAHYQETQHPVITSAETGESWAWCYPHKEFMKM